MFDHFLQHWSSSQCLLAWDQAETVILFFNSLEILKSSKLSSPTFCSSFSSAMVSPVSDRPWTSSKLESLKFVQEYGLIISSCCFRGSFINQCLISHFLQPWSSSQCLLGWDQAQTVLLLFLVLQQSWNLPNFPHQHFHLRLYMRWLIQFLSPFLWYPLSFHPLRCSKLFSSYVLIFITVLIIIVAVF